MSFWETVEAELEYQGIERKELAAKAGFDVSNIGKGLKNGNVPSADTAVRIARVLGVSVEYLVTGIPAGQGKDRLLASEVRLFHAYRPLLKKLDAVPGRYKAPLSQMIEELSKERRD